MRGEVNEMKIYINKEINPFKGEALEWSLRLPDLKFKFYHPELKVVLERLRVALEEED